MLFIARATEEGGKVKPEEERISDRMKPLNDKSVLRVTPSVYAQTGL